MSISHIAAVNHWRGQCLDNFARVEHAVISLTERWKAANSQSAPNLAQAASARSRNLVTAMRRHAPTDPKAKQAAKLLELWSHRERDRNDLVHGIFTVKAVGESWTLINRTIAVKSQVASVRDELKSAEEADAFLSAVIKERKAIVSALADLDCFA